MDTKYIRLVKLLSIIFFIQIYTPTYAQKLNKIDKLEYKFTYKLTYMDEPGSPNLKEEHMILLVGNKTSKFLSKGKYLRDSISRYVDRTKLSQDELANLYTKVPCTLFTYKIIKNYPNGKITISQQLLNKKYRYEQNLKIGKWKITKITDSISNYPCTKAHISFAGREYIAWFTTSIKIKEGPYKFNGLPGLIVKIYDSKNNYTYELIDAEKITKGQYIIFDENRYQKTPKEEYFKIKKAFFKEILQKIELSSSGLDSADRLKNSKRSSRFIDMKNPIELN